MKTDFSNSTVGFEPLSGFWNIIDGVYQGTRKGDFGICLAGPNVTDFDLIVKLKFTGKVPQPPPHHTQDKIKVFRNPLLVYSLLLFLVVAAIFSYWIVSKTHVKMIRAPQSNKMSEKR